ncbi:hypothetical protein [Streptomyces sp. NPDC058653]|uniref:hypothetical protein n=1 Tax=Streptomyces sp. NPDC058653 TaxID=3346576 RepID=UPI003658AE33
MSTRTSHADEARTDRARTDQARTADGTHVDAAHPQRPSLRDRLRAAWRTAHTPVPGVPRWARGAALAVPFTVLPSGLWRIAEVNGGSGHGTGDLPAWLPIELYVVVLSLVSELIAFTAVGLIAAWGEVWPRWTPVLRGRRIPPLAVVVPAALGALVLTTAWTAAAVTDLADVTLRGDAISPDYPGEAGGWPAVVFYLCYAPLLLWGPLLAALTLSYHRRRRRTERPRPQGSTEGVSARAGRT